MWNFRLAGAACMLVFSALASATSPGTTVTFVCEHGSAKSVIAAAYFNKIAEEKGLKFRAVSRGLTPDPQLQSATQTGLTKDGLNTATFIPTKLSAEDAQVSVKVITIGIEHEPGFLPTNKLAEWDGVPAVSAGYEPARDDMLKRIESLIVELQATEK